MSLRKHFLFLGLAVTSHLLFACSPPSATLAGQPDIPTYPKAPGQQPLPKGTVLPPSTPAERPVYKMPEVKWITQAADGLAFDFHPNLDILFVVDDSTSMVSHLDVLQKNIGTFVQGFKRNKMINYHIGVTGVWDSSQDTYNRRAAHTTKTGVPPFGIGELRPVKAANHPEKFLTSKDSESILEKTINVGVTDYRDGGPEIEEDFSVVDAVIGRAGKDGGFLRPDAHLVVIIVTDADDSTANPVIAPETMAQRLLDFKGGRSDLLDVYGVLVKATDDDKNKDWDLRISYPKYHPECFGPGKHADGSVDYSHILCPQRFGPANLEKFISAVNAIPGKTDDEVKASHILPINGSFGTQLGRIGSDISKRTLVKEIPLDQLPRKDGSGKWLLRLRYGSPADLARNAGTVIPEGARGWTLDGSILRVSGETAYPSIDDGRFAVDMVPVNVSL